jgi:glycosyltransferase involved in cell wall biosynthesis
MRGGESVLEAILEAFPPDQLFTLVHTPNQISEQINRVPIQTSWLQKIPQIDRLYRHTLPLMPQAIERFDLSGFDLILSSSHCVAKGIRKPLHALHVSYIHAPMRYMWDRYEDYFGRGRSRSGVRWAARSLRPLLQNWDRKSSSADRIDLLLANSRFIADRIQTFYGREAQVIYPFADGSRFERVPRKRGEKYLMVGAFAPYKRIDLAIDAFNALRLPLQIVGLGQDFSKLQKRAGPTIEFLGARSSSEIEQLYASCRAFIFPGLEDFGITPLEAMASGAPVIAYGAGGALETVTPETGLFFQEQTASDLIQTILNFEAQPLAWNEQKCRQRAAHFSKQRFQSELIEAVSSLWKARGRDPQALQMRIYRGKESPA